MDLVANLDLWGLYVQHVGSLPIVQATYACNIEWCLMLQRDSFNTLVLSCLMICMFAVFFAIYSQWTQFKRWVKSWEDF